MGVVTAASDPAHRLCFSCVGDGVIRATERRIELLVKPDLPIIESNPSVSAFALLRGFAWGAVPEKSMAGVGQSW